MRGWKGACRNRLREERHHQLVSIRTGGGGIHALEVRDCEYAVDVTHVCNPLDDPACLGIEDNHLTVTQVRNEQQMPTHIETRIVEPCRMTAEGYVGNGLQLQRRCGGVGGSTCVSSQQRYRQQRHRRAAISLR